MDIREEDERNCSDGWADTEDKLENNEYPLYPTLTDAGKQEAQRLADMFKETLAKAAEEVIGELCVDVPLWIESDSWSNFRNHVVNEICNYNNRHIQGDYDYGKIRKAIYIEYRDEIIADLNQDLVSENEQLKQLIAQLQDSLYGQRGY